MKRIIAFVLFALFIGTATAYAWVQEETRYRRDFVSRSSCQYMKVFPTPGYYVETVYANYEEDWLVWYNEQTGLPEDELLVAELLLYYDYYYTSCAIVTETSGA